jgi:hypothetical protein
LAQEVARRRSRGAATCLPLPGPYLPSPIQVSRGRGDESDAEGGDDEGSGSPDALPAVYRASDVAAYLSDVAARAAASRANAKVAMTFPGGLRIAVKVGAWGFGGALGGLGGKWAWGASWAW